jgi:hypothetical protein
MKQALFSFLGLISLASCDCLQQIDGAVFAEDTLLPIGDVEVRERNSDGTYDRMSFPTDMVGRFEFTGISGGPWGCPEVQLHFAKPGYLPVDRVFPSTASGDTIWMKPVNR